MNRTGLVGSAVLARTMGDGADLYRQRHLEPAPIGVGARWAFEKPGLSGRGVRFAVVELGWGAHRDTPLATGVGSALHGTRTLGVICGTGAGRGIAPEATLVAIETPSSGSLPELIRSLGAARPELLLLQVQTEDRLPVETLPGVSAAIRQLTDEGVVVVQPAGNARQDLDAWADRDGRAVLSRWSPDFFDSGAILVGAGLPTRQSARVGNVGTRVDCHAWGAEVVTTGGLVHPSGRGWASSDSVGYTRGFGGTSAAAAIVAGVCLAILSSASLSPARLRSLLRHPALGTPPEPPKPDVPGYRARNGRMPDLRSLACHLGLAPCSTLEGVWFEPLCGRPSGGGRVCVRVGVPAAGIRNGRVRVWAFSSATAPDPARLVLVGEAPLKHGSASLPWSLSGEHWGFVAQVLSDDDLDRDAALKHRWWDLHDACRRCPWLACHNLHTLDRRRESLPLQVVGSEPATLCITTDLGDGLTLTDPEGATTALEDGRPISGPAGRWTLGLSLSEECSGRLRIAQVVGSRLIGAVEWRL